MTEKFFAYAKNEMLKELDIYEFLQQFREMKSSIRFLLPKEKRRQIYYAIRDGTETKNKFDSSSSRSDKSDDGNTKSIVDSNSKFKSVNSSLEIMEHAEYGLKRSIDETLKTNAHKVSHGREGLNGLFKLSSTLVKKGPMFKK